MNPRPLFSSSFLCLFYLFILGCPQAQAASALCDPPPQEAPQAPQGAQGPQGPAEEERYYLPPLSHPPPIFFYYFIFYLDFLYECLRYFDFFNLFTESLFFLLTTNTFYLSSPYCISPLPVIFPVPMRIHHIYLFIYLFIYFIIVGGRLDMNMDGQRPSRPNIWQKIKSWFNRIRHGRKTRLSPRERYGQRTLLLI